MTEKPTVLYQFEIPMAIGQMAQIYALVDPRTSEIRYVGKAIDPKKRLSGHMRDSVLARYRDKRTSWLKSLKALGLIPSIVILETVPENDWQECERKWIAHFRSSGTNLTNTQDGGEGQSKGFRQSAEAIEKTASKLRGKKRDPEIGRKISEANKGRKMPAHRIPSLRAGLQNWWKEMPEEKRLEKMQKLWRAGMTKMAAANAHGQLGVSWSEERQKWVAYINVNAKRIPLGRFTSFDAAVAARKAAEARYFGSPQPVLT